MPLKLIFILAIILGIAILLWKKVHTKEQRGGMSHLLMEAQAISFVTGEPLEVVIEDLKNEKLYKRLEKEMKDLETIRIKEESRGEKKGWNPPMKINPKKNFVGTKNDYKGINQVKMRR